MQAAAAASRLLVAQPKERMLAIRGGLKLGARIWGDEDAAPAVARSSYRESAFPCTSLTPAAWAGAVAPVDAEPVVGTPWIP
jgi:hypothetical protein